MGTTHMQTIELDHTSSGVQIAAALSRDARTASTVNINGGSTKSDLYTVVMQSANERLAALGSDIVLKRADVKTAVIARIYGGGRGTAHDAFQTATGLKLTEKTAALFAAFDDAVKTEMSGVVTVQRYIASMVRAIAATGVNSLTVRLAHGGTETFRFNDAEKTERNVRVGFFGEKTDITDLTYSTGETDVSATAKTVTAAFIQSFDAVLLARVQTELAARGIYFLSKHDAYLIESKHRDALLEIVQTNFRDVFSVDHLSALRDDLSQRYGLDLKSFDHFGSYDVNAVMGSDFLISE